MLKVLPDYTQHDDGRKNGQRNGSRDDERASPVPEKDEDHERSQTGRNQGFPDDARDRPENKNGLISKRLDF